MSVNHNCRIIIDGSRVMLQIVASLNDDSRGVIYNYDVFIIEASDVNKKMTSFRGQASWATLYHTVIIQNRLV
jgi:hypothetical protein